MVGADACLDGEDPLDWSLLRTFVAVARHGSIASAVGDLGLSHPTIRRQLARLEGDLGASLFTRSQAGLAPTPLALRLLPHAERMEKAAAMVRRSAVHEDLTGTLRLVADGLIGAQLVVPALARLRDAHPGLTFELALSDTPLDMFRREADVALSLTRPVQQGVVASRVGSLRLALYASPDWLASHGVPRSLDDLVAGRRLVGGTWTARTAGLAPSAAREGFGLSCANSAVTISAISSAIGVGALPMLAADRAGLVQVLPDLSLAGDVWLSVHPDLRRDPHVRAVIDELRAAVTRERGTAGAATHPVAD